MNLWALNKSKENVIDCSLIQKGYAPQRCSCGMRGLRRCCHLVEIVSTSSSCVLVVLAYQRCQSEEKFPESGKIWATWRAKGKKDTKSGNFVESDIFCFNFQLLKGTMKKPTQSKKLDFQGENKLTIMLFHCSRHLKLSINYDLDDWSPLLFVPCKLSHRTIKSHYKFIFTFFGLCTLQLWK